MKGILVWIVGGVIVVAAAGFGIYTITRDESTDITTGDVQVGEQANTGATKTACDIFTPDIAVQILGASATKFDVPSAQASSDNVVVTNCTYDNGTADISALITANVLVRGAKNEASYESNVFGFEDTKTSATSGATPEPIDDLGDAAWYNPNIGQVNVLVDGGKYWVIAQAGAMDKARSEQLARAVVKNL